MAGTAIFGGPEWREKLLGSYIWNAIKRFSSMEGNEKVGSLTIMSHRPPKGVRPPQLEGKRSGRPKGARNWASAWRDCLWGYRNAENEDAQPPTVGAELWRAFAAKYTWEVYDFLNEHGVIESED